jgi:hypothetical protein
MQDSEREEVLDELCRRALTNRTELDLYLAYERKKIAESDPDFRRAKDIFDRNAHEYPSSPKDRPQIASKVDHR